MKPGIFLISTLLLDDTIFESAIIYLAEYNDKGAMGFIINKKFHRTLNELEEFKHIRSFPLYLGGPVDQEHLFFIHKRPDLIDGGTPIGDGVFMGGDFKSVENNINSGLLSGTDIKVFIGYCGWDKEELEAEITEGSWELSKNQDSFQEG